MTGYYVKNPGSSLDVTIDWAQQFLHPGETIAADLGWTVRPDMGATGGLAVETNDSTATTTTARLAAGQAGDAYLVASTIRTDQAREIRRSLTVRVANV
ncbi:MAG: hypothetical protein AAGH68_11425 [Pseudomonadota bacterium]